MRRTLPAQAPATKPAARADYSGEAIVFDRSETVLRMKADGTGERLQRVRMHVQSEGAVKQFSVLSFYFAADSETPHISGVRVTKPDGTTVETPATDALDVTAEVTRQAPLYSDLKQKQLPRWVARRHLLIASWDTLGWILYLNGKLDQAEPFLVAAWRNSYHPEVGDHLGSAARERGQAGAGIRTVRAGLELA